MSKKKCFKRKRRRGAVLAAVLLLGAAAVGAAALSWQVANKIFDDGGAMTRAFERENLALQAHALSKAWFRNYAEINLTDESAFLNAAALANPVIPVPERELAELKHENKSFEISASVIDLNYADSFGANAAILDIPRAKPSIITINDAASETEAALRYPARRFQIRVSAADKAAPSKKYSFAENVIILFEKSASKPKIYTLSFYAP